MLFKYVYALANWAGTIQTQLNVIKYCGKKGFNSVTPFHKCDEMAYVHCGY